MKSIWIISALALFSVEVLNAEADKSTRPDTKIQLLNTYGLVIDHVSYYKEPPPLLIASNETTEWKNHFNQLSSGNGIFSHIRIDDPYFEEMAKANKCKDESELLEVCFKSSSQQGHIQYYDYYIQFSSHIVTYDEREEEVDNGKPCRKLRNDFVKCVEEVVNVKEARERIELYYAKEAFYWKAFNRIQIEEPYLEIVAKAGRCTDEMRLMGICVMNQKFIGRGSNNREYVNLNFTNRTLLQRKEGIQKVTFYFGRHFSHNGITEIDADCTNLQLDLEECILRVVNEK